MSSEKHLWWRISALPVEFCNEPQIFPIFNLLFLMLYFQTYSILLLLVAKIGVSLLMQTSLQTFWRWKLYKSPSKRSSKSFQQMISELYLKSWRRITSAWSVRTQAYLSIAGSQKVWYICSSGFNINVYPQFVGPTTMVLLNFPQPRVRRSLRVSVVL